MRLRLVLRLILQRVCDAMRQAAKLAKQQSENEQKTDRQRRMHFCHCRMLRKITHGIFRSNSLNHLRAISNDARKPECIHVGHHAVELPDDCQIFYRAWQSDLVVNRLCADIAEGSFDAAAFCNFLELKYLHPALTL